MRGIRFVSLARLLPLAVVGLAAVLAVLPWGGSPTAFADPFSSSFDLQLDDDSDTSSGNRDGTVDPGESPDVITSLSIDPEETGDKAFLDLSLTVFNGLTPAYGVAITDGALVGTMDFSVTSNFQSAGTNVIDLSTGQPFVCGSGATLDDSDVHLFDADLGTGTDADLGLGPGVISEQETQEDNFGADGTGAPNGLADGIDLLPDALANYLIPSLALGSPIARSFGVATLLAAYGVKIDVNLLLYDLGGGEYLLISVLGYPGIPTEPPSASNVLNQTVIICPPFSSTVKLFGVIVDSPEPVPQRTAVAGDHKYEVLLSSGDNYDGDEAAAPYDSCPAVVSIDTDLAGHPDTDSDRWDSACDPYPESADNDNDGSAGPYATAPPWETDQDVDGDGILNTVDNCPFAADVDLDNADEDDNPLTGIDYQLDSDGDTVGDVCDLSPIVKGEGTGYAVTRHPHGFPGQPDGYHDHDQIWNDAFNIPGTEGSGDAVLENTVDSGNDGDPDFLDENLNSVYDLGEPIDSDGDADRDGHSDGCEAVMGSDPLDPASVPAGPPPFGDCDGDGAYDWAEEAVGSGLVSMDTDGDGCADGEELGPDRALGGQRDPLNPYDFYDITNITGVIGAKDKGVSGFDLNLLLAWGGAVDNGPPNPNGKDYDDDSQPNTVEDGAEMDFAGIAGTGTGPDGGISGFDLNQMLAEGGASCVAPP